MDSVTLLFHYLFLAGLGLITKKQKQTKKSYIFDKYEGHVTSKVKWISLRLKEMKIQFRLFGNGHISKQTIYVLPFWIAEEQESHK